MTVAIVVKGYPRLSETFVAQELRGLERRGIALEIVSLRHPTDVIAHPVHDEIAAPVRYLPEYLHQETARTIAGWRRARRLPGYAAAYRRFRRDLARDRTPNRVRRFGQACVMAAEIGADVRHVHAHFLHTPGSVARYAALMRGLPFSLSGHAKDVWTTPEWELREKLRDADWTVTCSAAAAETLRPLAPDGRVDLIYHGLDLARFPPPPARREATGPAQIVCVCRAVEKKGLDTLLGALARLPADASWRLTHIGAGPLLPSLQRQARALGIADRVTWHGAQAQTAVLDALRAGDIFAMAPRIAESGDRDGLPNVLLEAQSQGLPVVATRVSAIPELVTDGETGLLARPDDETAMADALLRLIGDPALALALGRAGERRVRGRFDSEAWLDRLALRFGNAGAASKRQRTERAA